jgi:hypothetical protein
MVQQEALVVQPLVRVALGVQELLTKDIKVEIQQ